MNEFHSKPLWRVQSSAFLLPIVLLALLLFSVPARAAVYYVNDTSTVGDSFTAAIGNDLNSGTSIASPRRTLASIDHLLVAGDTVYIDSGVFSEADTITIPVSSVWIIGKDSVSTIIKFSVNSQAEFRSIYASAKTRITIRDLRVTGGYTGVFFENVDSSAIERVQVDNNRMGIYLQTGSTGNTLSSNRTTANWWYGIYLYDACNYNTLTSNSCSAEEEAIYIQSCSFNTLTSNTVSGSSFGFELSEATHNTLTSNVSSGNQRGFYLSSSSDSNTLTSNTAGGSTGNAGIYLDNSSNNTLTSNTSSGNTGATNRHGIFLTNSSNCTLTWNTASGNGGAGIHLNGSANNVLASNTCTGNVYRGGIYLIGSSNNTLTSDTTSSNNEYGIYLDNTSHNNTLTSNTASANNNSGFYLNGASRCTLALNVSTGNSGGNGFFLSGSSNNTLTSNVATGNLNGIQLENFSDTNRFLSNTFSGNTQNGVWLENASNNTLVSNTISGNERQGMILYLNGTSLVTRNIVTQNTIDSNGWWAVYILSSKVDTVVKNVIGTSPTRPDSGIRHDYNGHRFNFERNYWIRGGTPTTDSALIRGMILPYLAGPGTSQGDSIDFFPFRLGRVDTTPGADTIAPKAPDTVAASGLTDTAALVTWSTPTANEEDAGGAVGLGGYRVYRSRTADTSFWAPSGSVASGTNSFTDSGMSPGIVYYFRVTAFDNHAVENQSFYSDSIIAVTLNYAPVISPVVPAQSRIEDTSAWTVALAGYATDSDAGDSLVLFWSVTGGGTVVTVSMQDSRTLLITPIADRNGTETVTLRVSDNRGTTTQPLAVTLAGVNDTPTFVGTVPAQTRTEDTSAWTVSLAGYATDSDAGDTLLLYWTVTGGGSVFTASMSDSRTLLITPRAEQNGTETVTLSVSDRQCTIVRSVAVTLTSVEDTPFFVGTVPAQTRTEDTTAWTVALTGYGSDSDAGDTRTLFWTVTGAGSVVTVTMADSRTLSIAPVAGQIGTETVTLRLSDNKETVTQSLAITLTPLVPAPPVLVSPANNTCTGSATVLVTMTKGAGTDTILVFRGGVPVDTIASLATTVAFTVTLDTATDTSRFTFKTQDARNGQVYTSVLSDTISYGYNALIPTSPTRLSVMSGGITTLFPGAYLVSGGSVGGSPRLLVTDVNGNGIPGQAITYTIVSKPSGSTGEAVTGPVTDASGISAVSFTVGSKKGEYIVKATTGNLTPVFLAFHTDEFSLDASKWALIALNRPPTSGALSSAFSSFTPTNIFHWKPSLAEHPLNQRYEIPTSLVRGQGYFMREVSAKTLSVNGTDVPSDTVDVPLVAGWNMLGSPYAYITRWANARIVTSGGAVLTPAEAQTQGIITNAIFAYLDNSYTWGPSSSVPDPLLRPWRGFWIKAAQSATLRFSPYFYYADTNSTTGGGALGVAAAASSTDQWTLTVTAAGTASSGATSTLGVSPQATNGVDFGADVSNPPVLQGMTASGFGVGSAGLAQDLKAPFTDAQQWFYTVVPGDGNATMTLTFGGLAALPEGFSAYIVDPAANAPVKLSASSPTYAFSASSARTLQIVVGQEDAARRLFALSLTTANTFVAPNPGPGPDGLVRFKYTAAVTGTLRLTVLDLAGVRVLDRVIDLGANPTEYAWDLRNDAGRRIGTGVYVYILEYKSPTTSSRIVDKMAIIR